VTESSLILERNLADLIATLEPDLARLHQLAPRFTALFTETALGVLTLEHALRKKGLLEAEELATAVVEAQAALARVRRRFGVLPSGRA
jgi:hypothetical protein